jgi:hypothetical protein
VAVVVCDRDVAILWPLRFVSGAKENREQDVTPATTTTRILGAIEALPFVLVGVVAVRLPILAFVPVLAAIVAGLLLIRWMFAAPAREREASSYLWRRYEQRSLRALGPPLVGPELGMLRAAPGERTAAGVGAPGGTGPRRRGLAHGKMSGRPRGH